MTPQEVTDALTQIVAAWMTMAGQQLDTNEKVHALNSCMVAPDCDVRVSVWMRAGKILLEGVNETAGQSIELFRENVQPATAIDCGHGAGMVH